MSDNVVKRLLIVDDDSVIVQIMEEGLRRLGAQYIIDTAYNGTEALAKISQLEYDLVISDYKMPGLNGLELAQIIRQKSPNTRLVILTSYGTQNLRDIGLNVNVDAFLDKPVSLKKVHETVKAAINQTVSNQQDLLQEPKGSSAKIKEQLATLRVNVNARAILLVSASGHLIEMVGDDNNLDIPNISVLVAANFMAATELAKLIGNETLFRSSYFDGPNFNVYAHDLNGECFLAVIFGSNSKKGVIHFYTDIAVEVLKTLIKDIDISVNDINWGGIEEVETQLDDLFKRSKRD